MGITVADPEVVPSLEYNNVHLEELKIVQSRPKEEPPYPKYELMITYRLFARDGSGTRYYSSKPQIVHIRDYMPKAMKAMEQHEDPRLLQALGAIEHALSIILDDSGKHGKTTVVQ